MTTTVSQTGNTFETGSARAYEPFMQQAIDLALLCRWQTAPNPSVGAILLQNGNIVAQGWHKGAGQPHAEVEAIAAARAAGASLPDCTLVVTLEPCNHHGKTPPCTQAILEAGIRRVVVGASDPNPIATGGIAFLQSQGVEVLSGVCEQDCLDLIDDFVTWQTTDFPYIIVKLASTLDGRIATRTGHSKWVSSEESRRSVHGFRKHMDAILVGGNTFHLDDPKLTCRNLATDQPEPKQPLAVIVTSRLPDAGGHFYLLRERPEQTIFWTTIATAASTKAEALRKLGVRVMGLPSLPATDSGRMQPSARAQGVRSQLDVREGLRVLRQEYGCLYLLCEGGGKLALSLMEKQLVRELHLHVAPKILGDNEATPLFDGRSPDTIGEALQLRLLDSFTNGFDLIMALKPHTTLPMENK